MTRVYYDQNGTILYTMTVPEGSDVSPPGAFVEVDDAAFDISCFHVVDGAVVARTAVTPELRAQATAGVNATVGRIRTRFITDSPGQQMTYMTKLSEARAAGVLGAEPADHSPWPFLAAEVGITGDTLLQVAQVVLNLADQWAGIGSALERARMSATTRIGVALTRAEIETAAADLEMQIAALLTEVTP